MDEVQAFSADDKMTDRLYADDASTVAPIVCDMGHIGRLGWKRELRRIVREEASETEPLR